MCYSAYLVFIRDSPVSVSSLSFRGAVGGTGQRTQRPQFLLGKLSWVSR